jgi:hypothetical protein
MKGWNIFKAWVLTIGIDTRWSLDPALWINGNGHELKQARMFGMQANESFFQITISHGSLLIFQPQLGQQLSLWGPHTTQNPEGSQSSPFASVGSFFVCRQNLEEKNSKRYCFMSLSNLELFITWYFWWYLQAAAMWERLRWWATM